MCSTKSFPNLFHGFDIIFIMYVGLQLALPIEL